MINWWKLVLIQELCDATRNIHTTLLQFMKCMTGKCGSGDVQPAQPLKVQDQGEGASVHVQMHARVPSHEWELS